MISATQMRPGMVIKYNNDLYTIFSVNHRTPGNLRGFVQAKMRNLRSGTMTENRFSSEDKVEKAIMEEHEMEYLYDDGEYYYFMNIETYEQMHLIIGNYRLRVEAPGFTVHVQEGVAVGVDLVTHVDVTLQTGEITQTVDVKEEVPLLKTERTDVSTTLSERAVTELPNLSRNFTEFLLLTPGTIQLKNPYCAWFASSGPVSFSKV